jgi:hypothetical protein
LTCPAGHEQIPAVQVDPDGQAWPHEPQFAKLVLVSTQVPLQFVCPAGQLPAHWPPEQTRPAAHAWPQVPQLALSVCTLVQMPLQLTRPAWHVSVQAPAEQV